jgi:hypothetical protein
MARLCERPACSEPGAIAYGFDADRALVWLAPLDPDGDRNRAGTLCLRHADAMVVPMGWTLEDARDPMPRLFKPAARVRPARPSRRSSGSLPSRSSPARTGTKRTKPPAGEQLSLVEVPRAETPPSESIEEPVASTVVEVTGVSSSDDPDVTVAIPWMPEFDITDELGGALSAETPLLARAFRGVDRHP